ncbi:glutathione S-transferase family protein [Vagococcus sp.]|uniref:glutathione S-transferase family protein n=1 Tax=Vagococcus sp. TaxID=1933889 RepID=UPI002FC76991
MGLLVEGKWQDQWYDTKSTGGHFVRKESQFRNWITPDGSAGPSGVSGFKAEAGRYHLYVSYACPWASRALIMRKLKGLEEMISLSVVNYYMGENGWTFEEGKDVITDPIINANYLYEIYAHVDPTYTGRVTVPILYDKKTNQIVNNESSEIMRMLNTAFDEIGALAGDYYPEELRVEIDEMNEKVYHGINNGVYKTGFATKQEVYEREATQLFTVLDELEEHLSSQKYLVGERLTEADWRLFVTLVRFDSAYYGHFKCNIRELREYPHLWRYTRELYNYPGIKETVNFHHIKHHYYGNHPTVNPNRIIPVGPILDWRI